MPARQSTNASARRVEAQGKVVLPSCSFGCSRCGQSSLTMYMTTVTTSGHLQAAVNDQQQSHGYRDTGALNSEQRGNMQTELHVLWRHACCGPGC